MAEHPEWLQRSIDDGVVGHFKDGSIVVLFPQPKHPNFAVQLKFADQTAHALKKLGYKVVRAQLLSDEANERQANEAGLLT